MTTSTVRPFPAWLTRNGGWLIPLASYVLAWSLWLPLLGRDMENVATLPADFLLLALLGNVMPGVSVIAWRLIGARVPPGARSDLPRPRYLPLLLGAALAAVPVMTVAGIGIQTALGQPFAFGDVGSRLLIGVTWPVVAALGEEFAWRGTALPLLRIRFGLLRAALLVGLAWGFWHLPADWIGLKSQGAWFWPQFILQGPVLLTSHSVIVTWIWARSGGRTLAAILYHVGITGSAILLGNQAAFADARFSFLGNLAGVAVVACVAAAAGVDLARRDRAALAARA
jgi:membrane protease YdiL (CAAX protease family)